MLVPTETTLLMTFAEQVRVELVDVTTLFSAYVAFPRVSVRVASFVEEVEGLIGKADPAEDALKVVVCPFAPRRFGRGLLLSRRGDGAVGGVCW